VSLRPRLEQSPHFLEHEFGRLFRNDLPALEFDLLLCAKFGIYVEVVSILRAKSFNFYICRAILGFRLLVLLVIIFFEWGLQALLPSGGIAAPRGENKLCVAY